MKTKRLRNRRVMTRRNSRRDSKNKLEFIHPALYQKQGAYGMSTYSRQKIPVGTVIIREQINNISDLTKDSPDYQFALIAKLLETNKTNFMNLVPSKLDNTTIIDYETIRDRHLQYLPFLSENEAKLCFMKYKRNAFSFNMNPGILFYATKLNHSCSPHVKYYPAENNIMVFETIRQINANEEVFDSYISSQLPKSERQSILMTRYGFDCQCSKCKTEPYTNGI